MRRPPGWKHVRCADRDLPGGHLFKHQHVHLSHEVDVLIDGHPATILSWNTPTDWPTSAVLSTEPIGALLVVLGNRPAVLAVWPPRRFQYGQHHQSCGKCVEQRRAEQRPVLPVQTPADADNASYAVRGKDDDERNCNANLQPPESSMIHGPEYPNLRPANRNRRARSARYVPSSQGAAIAQTLALALQIDAIWDPVRDEPLPAVAAVVSFIDAINRGDISRLGDLTTEDHHLDVFDEPPLCGRDANLEAWRGYATAFPRYLIYPERLAEHNGEVAVLGHTTGSHLGLPDAEEERFRLIWKARVEGGKLACWQLLEDSVERRRQCGLADPS
ncbi:MAG: hypothetical protein JWN99_3351 [Ilumatobacteraceae bacterium]|nr:hypothetical protein [Ilumatobacteraceae bacterium]